jgi:hypothetical protein
MVVAMLQGAALLAQDAAKAPDDSMHTLHVYVNTIQIPVLVLGPQRQRLEPIAPNRFSVSIDAGPWYRATHVRAEGEDPISLAILLDVRGESAKLMPKMAETISALAPSNLHAKDHVSVYALDCSLIRTLDDVPAESAQLKLGIDNVLGPWAKRKQNKHESDCRPASHLWDSIAYIVNDLDKVPGRRVMLVVSDGHDDGSTYPWGDVSVSAQMAGVAIFGLRNTSSVAISRSPLSRVVSGDPFNSLCELSGGVVLSMADRSLEESLRWFTTILRERYIVEFPRPGKPVAGSHNLDVKIAKGSEFLVRPAGISVPIPDAAVLTDPTTVPSDPSQTPEIGTRRVAKKPQ